MMYAFILQHFMTSFRTVFLLYKNKYQPITDFRVRCDPSFKYL